MSDTPNVLREKNSVTSKLPSVTLSNSKLKIHSSHYTSHLNSHNNTPINSRSKIAFGSSKVDSAKKKPASQISKLTTSVTTLTSTPPKSQIPSILKPGSTSKNAFLVNPICKGVDYTEVMLKKSQFGYTGPGYIVEYDCDSKHLRGLRVEKGLWKVTTRATNKTTEAILGIGMNYTRIDDPDKCTPLKQLTNYDFSYKPQSEIPCGFSRNIMSNFSSDDMNLECKTNKSKKSLRWAEDLVRIEENQTTSYADVSFEQLAITGTTDSSKPRRKLRKSLSMSDINDLIDEPVVDNEEFSESSMVPKLEQESNKENLNLTYDKDEKKSSPASVSKVIHYVVHISPVKVVNSSFLDVPVTSNFLQPGLPLPIISPVKSTQLNETQTLAISNESNHSFQNSKIKDIQSTTENLDWEKKFETFVETVVKSYNEMFGNENCDLKDDESTLKTSFMDAINEENRYNIILNYDKLEQILRAGKMEILKKKL